MFNACVRFLGVCAFVIALSHVAYGQCATQYSDISVSDDGSTLYAYNNFTDNYTNSSSGCAPQYWVNFTHSYTLSVMITSPSGRTASGMGFSNQSSGSGTGYAEAATSLAVLGEEGDYQLDMSDSIDCSVAGQFYNASDSFPFGVSIHDTYYTDVVDSWIPFECYYRRLACLPGTAPTCGLGQVTLGNLGHPCPLYAAAAYLVLKFPGGYYTCSIGISSAYGGPGPCN